MDDLTESEQMDVSEFFDSMDDGERTAAEALKALGFAPEIGGGGALFLSLYLPNGWHIWATGGDGCGWPAVPSYCLCAYPPNSEGGAEAAIDVREAEGSDFESDARRVLAFAASGGCPEGFAIIPDYDPTRDGTAAFRHGGGTAYPCHRIGTYWNGFEDVRVSEAVRVLLIRDAIAEGDDPADPESNAAQLLAIQPDGDGLIPLAMGWANECDPAPFPAALYSADRRALVAIDTPDRGLIQLSFPTIGEALNCYFPIGEATRYYSDRDATEPMDRDYAARLLMVRHQGFSVTFYNEDGDRLVITAEIIRR